MAASVSRSIWSRVADVASLATTPLTPAHYLQLVRPSQDPSSITARIESVSDETSDARTLTLRPGYGWRRHRAGQFVRVGAEIDGRIVTRTYSISSSPDRTDGRITITVKAIPGGRMSGFLVRGAKPGGTLRLGQPVGEFVLPEETPARVLFVTAGSGVTPVMSMLRTMALRGTLRDVVHLHYAPSAWDVIFGRELARLAAEVPGYRFVLAATREGRSRRFAPAELDAVAPDWKTRDTWACGPESLLGSVQDAFAQAGAHRMLRVERFRPKLAPAAPAASGVDRAALRADSPSGGRVRFGLSRADVEADGRTPLLDVAERAGLRPPSGCRMGICHSCDATMVSGCVRDLRTGERIDEPGVRVQVCVCAAAGDVEIDL
jgi:ferredoxin-NADP reductase